MQSKWLAKSATAIVLVALMAAETVNPVPAYAGVPGIFATEYTQILNYLQLIGSLEKQVLMVENQLTQIADDGEARSHDHQPALRDRGIGYYQSQSDCEDGPIALLHDEQSGRNISASASPATHRPPITGSPIRPGVRQVSIASAVP